MVESICVSKGFDGQVEVAMDEPGCFGQPGSGLDVIENATTPVVDYHDSQSFVYQVG